MPTAAFANLGCKVNQYEIDKIVDSFVARGFEVADFNQPADVYVINTCSVTGSADTKSRYMARRAARQKDGARVVLTGCFAQLAIDTGETVAGAALLVPNSEKMRVADHTLAAFPELVQYSGSPAAVSDGIAVFPEEAGLLSLDVAGARPRSLGRTRATLKVQDGCEHFCAFCSIPYTRNTMASRRFDAVIEEARVIAHHGVREVVVTGVCVGAYRDGGIGLADMLLAVADVPGIERVRLSSIQPIETDEALIAAVASHPNICPHLHLSLQSGDDTVLKAMQRPYDTGYYRDLVARLRVAVPGIAITTDIIVGFPGETAELFANTMAFAEEMAFIRAHLFRYSPRQRTYAAATFKDDVSDTEKDRRHKALAEVCLRSQAQYARKLDGQTVPVLVEGRGRQPGYMSGYTDTYVRVHFPGERAEIGQIVDVTITGVGDDAEAVADRCGLVSAAQLSDEREHSNEQLHLLQNSRA
ncbi:MAG TPA: tRNA (N(6)-L-threonylcarbamoyladenosine(37)-C(2))-methylthiotransferase MtaB [Capsulimonadaceae bacterium]|jgi:threonylcarbamoyladenosine tRNA methylthiotransferase MtaB